MSNADIYIAPKLKKMTAMILMNIILNKLNALKLLLKRIAIGISVAHMRSVLLVSFE